MSESESVRVTIIIGGNPSRDFIVSKSLIDAMGHDPAWYMLDGAMADIARADEHATEGTDDEDSEGPNQERS